MSDIIENKVPIIGPGGNPQKGRTRKYHAVLDLWLLGLTYAEIGRRLGFSRQCAQQFIRPPWRMQLQVIREAKGDCEICGRFLQYSGHIHHKARVNPPNLRANLQYLCISCHRLADSPRRRSK